jgi:enediyne biosynthesis protein E4
MGMVGVVALLDVRMRLCVTPTKYLLSLTLQGLWGGVFLLLVACSPKTVTTTTGAGGGVSEQLFKDVTASSGLSYKWVIEGKRPLNILQTIGNGCAFLDYNQDGNLDILLVGKTSALFRGDGKGQFTDVSQETGITSVTGHLLGCAVGDYDNDGLPDIYLTGWRDGRLLHNEKRAQGNQFVDVSKSLGMQSEQWGTSAAFVQTGKSPFLDLVVCNYAKFGPEPGIVQLCDSKDSAGKPILTSCGPRRYEPVPAAWYRNQDGKFQRSTLSQTTGRGLGVTACDIEQTGSVFLSFANDEIAGDLLEPTPEGYKNIAAAAGTAYDRDGNVHGGMGTDWGDIDNDGKFDLFVATFQNEVKSLYHNEGNRVFLDTSYINGIGTPTSPLVAFGGKFLDFNNDGWLDLIIANGHVQDNIMDIEAKTLYRQPTQLFQSKGIVGNKNVVFDDRSNSAGDLPKAIVGRGLAIGDYDNDGRIDTLIVDSEGEPHLLHNENTEVTNHWLGIQLEGTKCNRDGYGSVLTAEVEGRKIVRYCHADGSYMSSSDSRVILGIGTAKKIDKLTIRWSDGTVETKSNLPLDRYISLTEGKE